MDVIKLERVLRQFKRVLLGLKYLSYKEKLDRLGTYSLLRETLRGDLIKVYKTIGLDNVESWSLFQTFFQKPHFSGQSHLKLEGIDLWYLGGNFFHMEGAGYVQQTARGNCS